MPPCLEKNMKMCYNLEKYYIFGRIIYVNCRKRNVPKEFNEQTHCARGRSVLDR